MTKILQTTITAAFTLTLMSLAACRNNDMDVETLSVLPAGKHPLEFTVTVPLHSLSVGVRGGSVNGEWSTKSRITVAVNGETGEYRPTNINGNAATLTSDNPFYWHTADESKQVSGWSVGGNYMAGFPTQFRVKEDQCPNEGYFNSDFLYAPPRTIGFRDEDKSLNFYHQTARVVVNLRDGDALTSALHIKQVSIGYARNLAMAGSFTQPESDAATVEWTPIRDPQNMLSVYPHPIDPAPGCVASYAGMVIPQNMEGKKFIAATLTDNNTYFFTPAGTQANLQAGKQHTYTLTLKYGELQLVTASVDGTWGDGRWIKSTQIFTADNLKPGDYYYSDGTYSDGGLRETKRTGWRELSHVMADETIMPLPDKTPVGIVFCADKEFVNLHSTHTGKGYRALVMALKNAGYTSMQGGKAAHAAANYHPKAPASSSGWYLPNIGELQYACVGIENTYFVTAGKDLMEKQFANLNPGSAENFSGKYWSSHPENKLVSFEEGTTFQGRGDWNYPVRSVLAF